MRSQPFVLPETQFLQTKTHTRLHFALVPERGSKSMACNTLLPRSLLGLNWMPFDLNHRMTFRTAIKSCSLHVIATTFVVRRHLHLHLLPIKVVESRHSHVAWEHRVCVDALLER